MAKKIMVVDDKENIRVVLRDIFEQLGYTVTVAATGEKALAVIDKEKEKPDLMLLDTELNTVIPGGMYGFEVCRQVKQVKKLSTKVVMYTGTLGMVDAVKARHMGADDYIIKAENTENLVDAVKKLIGDATNEKE